MRASRGKSCNSPHFLIQLMKVQALGEPAMAPIEFGSFTVDEYLMFEETALDKHEYDQGKIRLLRYATFRHCLIVPKVIACFANKLPRHNYHLLASKMRIKTNADFYSYVDFSITGKFPEYEIRHEAHALLNPILLVEIAGPAQETYDRLFRFERFQELESLQDYLIVAQDYAGIDHYSRKDDGWFIKSYYKGETVPLKNLGIELSLDEVYRDIEFPHPPPQPPDLHIVRDYKPGA